MQQQRNAIWAYTAQPTQPINTPAVKASVGTGRTGNPAQPGTSAVLPAFVSEPDYEASPNSYAPRFRDDFTRAIPRSINQGVDGLAALNPTYRAHDWTLAQYFSLQNRRADYWQQQEFPPDFRDLVQWQQVQKYQIFSHTISARPLDPSKYFLGYTTDPALAGQIGASGLGYMGG